MNTIDTLADGKNFDFWEKEVTYTRELFVDNQAPNASDTNDGSAAAPFKTIQAAADIATPGTRIWIRPGIYRECVRPRAGGTDAEHMICYQAVEKGTVFIKASEVVTGFSVSDDWRFTGFSPAPGSENMRVWAHRLDPDMFRGYNPFCCVNIIHDRLFIEFDKTDMTPYLNRRGMIFCDGKPLRQVPLSDNLGDSDGTYWVEANGQTVHFRLPGDADPKDHLIELTCREQCFAPETPFLNYIKVKGLVCAHAAMGAPIPQRGAISACRGTHWVIEDCTVDWANATGIDVGNECWHHKHDFEKEAGVSVIRRCHIKDAGVCGIAGLWAVKMLVEDNLIEGTGWQKMELSWEAGALKFHNSVDALFRRNIFRRTYRADHLWLDCGNVNNRITQNLFLDGIEQREAIFIECTREGVNLIDNNIFWNVEGRFDPAKIPVEPGSSGWYKMTEDDVINGYAIYGEGTDRLHISHNFIGKCRSAGYFAKPVAFRVSPWMRGGTSREAKFYNNVFYACGEAAIKMPTEKNFSDGNLFSRMGCGGYLRVINPPPEACLDLKSWQEFYGFDKNGQEICLDFAVDTENLTLEVFPGKQDGFFRHVNALPTDPAAVRPVAPNPAVSQNFYAEPINGDHLPGPFRTLETGRLYAIDPRIPEAR